MKMMRRLVLRDERSKNRTVGEIMSVICKNIIIMIHLLQFLNPVPIVLP